MDYIQDFNKWWDNLTLKSDEWTILERSAAFAGYIEGISAFNRNNKNIITHRYFRVHFKANHPKGNATGSVMYTTDGTYLGGRETISEIEKTNGVTNVSILSITELSESDYNYYMKN